MGIKEMLGGDNEQVSTGITPEQLQAILTAAITAARVPNAKEQRELDKANEDDKRRLNMSLQLGKIEQEAQDRKRNGCSHMRYVAGQRFAGHAAPRGALNAEWATAGQALQNGTAAIICQRCSTVWIFRPAPGHYAQIMQDGLLGAEPPRPEDCVKEIEPEPVHA